MNDGEKRIVTFVGDRGKKTANLIWRNVFDLFEVECIDTDGTITIANNSFFKSEAEAQTFAENFVWGNHEQRNVEVL
jgi:hypothetical protein